MIIDIRTTSNLLFSSSYTSKKTELEKAKEISAQIASSIEWLNYEADKEEDYQKKNNILMEAEAARRELIRINKEINKSENKNE